MTGDGSPIKPQVKLASGFVAREHARRTGGTVADGVAGGGFAADTTGTRMIQRRSPDRIAQITGLGSRFIMGSPFMAAF
jgi:hypothetical protein